MNKSRLISSYHLSEVDLLCTSCLFCRHSINDLILQGSKKASLPTKHRECSFVRWKICVSLIIITQRFYALDPLITCDTGSSFTLPWHPAWRVGEICQVPRFPQPVELPGSFPVNHVYRLRCIASPVLQTLQWTCCLASESEEHSCCSLHYYRNVVCAKVFTLLFRHL